MTGSSLCPAPRYNGEVGDIVVGRITEVKLGFPDVPWRRRAARCPAARLAVSRAHPGRSWGSCRRLRGVPAQRHWERLGFRQDEAGSSGQSCLLLRAWLAAGPPSLLKSRCSIFECIYQQIIFLLQVQQKRWKVETNSRLDSVLLLSSMNLPGGELVSVAHAEQCQSPVVFRFCGTS